MKNGKKSKLCIFAKIVVYFIICILTSILLLEVPHFMKNIIALAIVLSGIVTLLCISIIMFIYNLENVFKSEDPEKDL